MIIQRRNVTVIAMLAGLLLVLSACERTQSQQLALRGMGQEQLDKPSKLAELARLNQVPKPLKRANPDGPRASEAFQNVQVLGDYSKSEFARTMSSIKNWVAPQEGCGLCHIAPTYNFDDKYQKRVARRMIQMVRRINMQWSQHVGATGVTCYTCHRGQAVPARTWYLPAPLDLRGATLRRNPVHLPTAAASTTALPVDALQAYLLGSEDIRVVGTQAMAGDNRHSIKQAKRTYSLMMVMAESLGVNCDYCHNTRAFSSWEQSRPQRATAWWGIRMVRDLNNNFIMPLTPDLPPERLGPAGDAPKIYCATCHQGVFKPLYGVSMVQDFPELIAPKTKDYVGGPPEDQSVVYSWLAKPDDGTEAGSGGEDTPAAPATAGPRADKAR